MAIFTPGPTVGAVSGSIGGTTYSHNRGGAYMRVRRIPTKSFTAYAMFVKATMASVSRLWAGLDANEQQAWRVWAQNNPITNRLGNQVTLAGHMAFMQLNNRLVQAGNGYIELPPVVPAPVPLTSFSAVADVSDNTCVLTFAASPIGANNKLWLEAAVVDGPGISYVENLFKLIDISAANQATGLDVKTELQARFGNMIADQVIHWRAAILDTATGLLSGPITAQTTVVG